MRKYSSKNYKLQVKTVITCEYTKNSMYHHIATPLPAPRRPEGSPGTGICPQGLRAWAGTAPRRLAARRSSPTAAPRRTHGHVVRGRRDNGPATVMVLVFRIKPSMPKVKVLPLVAMVA